nr:hypothetical protein [Tanacetum cinerariifolium]
MVINSLCLNNKKELAIPGQTTTGKESSNPLMADSLPKTMVPTKLVKPRAIRSRDSIPENSENYHCVKPQRTQKHRRAKRGWDTEIPQSSVPSKKVGDEAVYIGEDDKVVWAATTATSLEAEQESGSGPRCQDTTLRDAAAQTRFETVSKKSHNPPLIRVNTPRSGEDSFDQNKLTTNVPPTPYDSPLLGINTPGSDEDSMKLKELMVLYIKLSNRVLALEQSKTAQDLVIKKLQENVKRIERRIKARTTGMTLFKIGNFRRKSLDKENVSNQGSYLKTRPMFEERDFDNIDDMTDEDND